MATLPSIPPALTMVCAAVSDARIGDGFRTGFVLRQRQASAVLYVPSLLTSVTVPTRSLATAQAVRYRPKVVRGHMLARARLYRRHGHRFEQAATVEVLRRLGAAKVVIEETVSTTPLLEVAAARGRKAMQAERAAETAAAVRAIGERIDLRQEEWQLGGSMPQPCLDAPVADEPPWADALTSYDEAHLITYLRLLDAEAAGAGWREVAWIVLRIEPEQQPGRAWRAHETHRARAHWMPEAGYRRLLRRGSP